MFVHFICDNQSVCSLCTSTGAYINGQLQRKYKLLSCERALKILKNDICVTEIGQAVLKILHFRVDIPRKDPKIRISLNVSIKCAEQ